MENQLALAGLYFQEKDERVYGPITRFHAREMTVRLQNRPQDASLLRPDGLVEVTVIGKGMLGKGMAHIRSERDGVVSLLVEEELRETRRRLEKRQKYALPAAFRSLAQGDSGKAWYRAETLDLSSNGLCLRTEDDIALPQGREAQIVLGTISGDPKVEALLGGVKALPKAADGERAPVIRLTTVVRRVERQSDGATVMGMQFIAMEPPDRKRLSDLLSRG